MVKTPLPLQGVEGWSLFRPHGPPVNSNNKIKYSYSQSTYYCCCLVTSVVSDSVRPQRRQPTRLPRPWDSPGKNTSGLPFPSPMHESESEVAQSCLTLSDPMDCSLSGSSMHGIFQARVLEWGAIIYSTLGEMEQLEVVLKAIIYQELTIY